MVLVSLLVILQSPNITFEHHNIGSDFWYGKFLFHNFFVGNKLQNSNNARQGIRLCSLQEVSIAVLQLEM